MNLPSYSSKFWFVNVIVNEAIQYLNTIWHLNTYEYHHIDFKVSFFNDSGVGWFNFNFKFMLSWFFTCLIIEGSKLSLFQLRSGPVIAIIIPFLHNHFTLDKCGFDSESLNPQV